MSFKNNQFKQFTKFVLFLTILVSLSLAFFFAKKPQEVSSFGDPAPITRNVLVLDFNPLINGVPLSVSKGWYDNVNLEPLYISDVNTASHGYVNYQIVSTQNIANYPYKPNNYRFTNAEYQACIDTNGNSSPHCNEKIDYNKLFTDYNICTQVNSGAIHEVWLWGGPWFGYDESRMAGPNADDLHMPIVYNTGCTKDVYVMGFNYELDQSYMLHNLGHRVEYTMEAVYNDPTYSGYACIDNPPVCPTNRTNPWQRFIIWDKILPNKSGCGNVHTGPNNNITFEANYYYDLTNSVTNYCNDFLNYPSTTGVTTQVSCTAWNPNCNSQTDSQYEFEKWWLSHLPTKTGLTNNIRNNWWMYVVNYASAKIEPNFTEKWYIVDAAADDWAQNGCGYYHNEIQWFDFGEWWEEPCPAEEINWNMKFDNIKIPQGAVITNAYVQFVAYGTSSPTPMNLYVKALSNNVTTNSTLWVAGAWSDRQIINTSSITPRIQTIVSNANWTPGQSITIKVTRNSNPNILKRVRTFNGGPDAAPRLIIVAAAP